MNVTSSLVPEVCAQVKTGGKRPITNNRGASSCRRESDSVCLTVLDGHFQLFLEEERVLQVCHYPELQLAFW